MVLKINLAAIFDIGKQEGTVLYHCRSRLHQVSVLWSPHYRPTWPGRLQEDRYRRWSHAQVGRGNNFQSVSEYLYTISLWERVCQLSVYFEYFIHILTVKHK